MWQAIKFLHQNVKARCVQWFWSRQVARSLRATHEIELQQVPVQEWGLARQQQRQEILAVQQGRFGTIDRRSWAYPYIPEALHRLNQPILKNTPYNLRRFSETPIPRRAINLIKNAIMSLKWHVVPMEDVPEKQQQNPELLREMQVATFCLKHPNNQDSFRTLMEAVTEDLIIGGYGTIEPRITPDADRPVKMWAVDGSTIRIYADWSEATPDRPHYAQLTGLKGERGIISFLDDELVYIRDNVRSSTPFGWGKLETCFLSINAFLGAQDMSGRAAADQIHKTWLWWKTAQPPAQMQTVQRHVQNELEGQAKVSLVAGMPLPDTLDINPVKPDDLLLEWQNFLIRIIAAGFDLSPLALGLERDVNRNTAEVMSAMDFDSAVLPLARKLEDALTRRLLHQTFGYKTLQFEYIGLDDPDIEVQVEIFSQIYNTNAMTPDEIREKLQLGPALPGGWGRLTKGQMQLLIAAATKQQPQMGGYGGGGGEGGPPDEGYEGVSSLAESPFSASDVAGMSPNVILAYQRAGLLPRNTKVLAQEMEDEQPGILETLTEQLEEFFDALDEQSREEQGRPAKTTAKDQKEQQKAFLQREQDLSREEQVARMIEQNRSGKGQRFPTVGFPGRWKNWQGPRSGGVTGRFR